MKESSKASPFAAKTPQEQKEQWIWWQCQQTQAPEKELIAETEGASVLHTAPPVQMQTNMPMHRQYDAVLKRMQEAGKHAGSYQLWKD